MSELPREQVEEYVGRARQYYQLPGQGALPYHNWGHAVDVCQHADEIAALSQRKRGSQVNRSLLLVAAAWHDAGYHVPLEGFPTKEYRSAALARLAMPELSEQEQGIIAASIIDTTVNKYPKSSNQGIALHFADIGYMAAPGYDVFLDSLGKMREEWGAPSWDEAVVRTMAFGEQLLLEAQSDLARILTAEDLEAWVARLETNIAFLQAGRGIDENNRY